MTKNNTNKKEYAMKVSQQMIENGKMMTATAPNDTMRILSICISALTEARDELHRQNGVESKRSPDGIDTAGLLKAITARSSKNSAPSSISFCENTTIFEVAIDKDHTASIIMCSEDLSALDSAVGPHGV